jgi:hypothetical protein
MDTVSQEMDGVSLEGVNDDAGRQTLIDRKIDVESDSQGKRPKTLCTNSLRPAPIRPYNPMTSPARTRAETSSKPLPERLSVRRISTPNGIVSL